MQGRGGLRCLLGCLLGPVDPSFRALSGRLKLTVRRHQFNKDSVSSLPLGLSTGVPRTSGCEPPNLCRGGAAGVQSGGAGHGARPVHQIISMIKWIRTSRLSIKNSLCAGEGRPGYKAEARVTPEEVLAVVREKLDQVLPMSCFVGEGASNVLFCRGRVPPVSSFDARGGACGLEGEARPGASNVISHTVFLKSFCRSQLPHKSVNLSFTITNIKNKLTDLCMTFYKTTRDKGASNVLFCRSRGTRRRRG